MSLMYWFIGFYFSGVIIFVTLYKHLLMVLLSLEYLMLMVYFMMFYFVMGSGSEVYFCIVYLVFAVCEGALGLGLLVLMMRTHGNDYFQSFTLSRW